MWTAGPGSPVWVGPRTQGREAQGAGEGSCWRPVPEAQGEEVGGGSPPQTGLGGGWSETGDESCECGRGKLLEQNRKQNIGHGEEY